MLINLIHYLFLCFDQSFVTIVSLTTQDIYRDQTVIAITRLEIWR